MGIVGFGRLACGGFTRGHRSDTIAHERPDRQQEHHAHHDPALAGGQAVEHGEVAGFGKRVWGVKKEIAFFGGAGMERYPRSFT